jgi:hypothetical protein
VQQLSKFDFPCDAYQVFIKNDNKKQQRSGNCSSQAGEGKLKI